MRTFRRALVIFTTGITLIAPALVTSCNSGDRSLELVDPNAAPQNPDFELVFNIIQNECAPCHKGGDDGDDRAALVRQGVEPPLDSCQDIIDEFDNVWETIEENTMPPGAWPRLSATEKLIIKRWYNNGAVTRCE